MNVDQIIEEFDLDQLEADEMGVFLSTGRTLSPHEWKRLISEIEVARLIAAEEAARDDD